jgi:hypothetical protein
MTLTRCSVNAQGRHYMPKSGWRASQLLDLIMSTPREIALAKPKLRKLG